MAVRKINAIVKLQLPAGKATPGPPVGSSLGPHGINIAAFTKEFNDRTAKDAGLIINHAAAKSAIAPAGYTEPTDALAETTEFSRYI